MFKSTQNKATHDARCVKGTCNCLNHKAKAALTTAKRVRAQVAQKSQGVLTIQTLPVATQQYI